MKKPKDWDKDYRRGSTVTEFGVIDIASYNAAIEEAAKHCDDMGEEARISENIRELKK